ncbi:MULTISPECIES: hypothetical protein [Phyllobacteriaceae]|jgi:uncharacterized membrane protein (GlpM family)|nr:MULTISPECIES: hypothetical protein [Mesorhizobium]MBN9234209.1 hypothetical protein [Mesorhizobium sp.]MDQ0332274.1 putative membrane protein (GlpM family) [Mesorhizobium sp. YL-MeA3-2017]
MTAHNQQQPSRPWPKWLGWLGLAILVAATPVALLAMSMPANEYKAGGVDAVDCDGPISALLFAIPALLLYGVGAVVNGHYFRDRLNLVIAVICTVACLLIAANIVGAAREQMLMDRDPQVCG